MICDYKSQQSKMVAILLFYKQSAILAALKPLQIIADLRSFEMIK